MRRITQHATPSMVVAIVALIVAFSGSAVAAKSLIDGRGIKRRSISADRLTAAAVAPRARRARPARGETGERVRRARRARQAPRARRAPPGRRAPKASAASEGGRPAGRARRGRPRRDRQDDQTGGADHDRAGQRRAPTPIELPLPAASWTQPADQAQIAFATADFSSRPACAGSTTITLALDGLALGTLPVSGTTAPIVTPPSADYSTLLAPRPQARIRTVSATALNICSDTGQSFTLSDLTVTIMALN